MGGVPVYDGGRFYLSSLKNQVNLGVSIICRTKEEISRFEGSGKTSWRIKIHQLLSDDEKKSIIEELVLMKSKAGIPK